jgi:hypothetical protein
MPTILIIEKSGSIKELNVKTYSEDELYKKAGFKTSEGFKLVTNWDVNIEDTKYFISVFGKVSGRAGQENKYEFPPPIDSTLLFGNCVLVNQLECEPVSNLKKSEWDKIYEQLYGGFEDLSDVDSELSQENESDKDLPRTISGYVKDDFIVDDNDSEVIDDTETEDESEEEQIIKKKVKKAVTAKESKKTEKKEKVEKKVNVEKKLKKATVFEKIDTTSDSKEPSVFLDCSSELEEEEYV